MFDFFFIIAFIISQEKRMACTCGRYTFLIKNGNLHFFHDSGHSAQELRDVEHC